MANPKRKGNFKGSIATEWFEGSYIAKAKAFREFVYVTCNNI